MDPNNDADWETLQLNEDIGRIETAHRSPVPYDHDDPQHREVLYGYADECWRTGAVYDCSIVVYVTEGMAEGLNVTLASDEAQGHMLDVLTEAKARWDN